MTDRQMRHMISHAIAAVRPSAEEYYHVCWWEEAVRCHPVRHTTERHEVFLSTPGSVFLGELSAVQWRLMANRILDFCRRQGIVLDLHSGRGQKTSEGRMRRRWVTEYDATRLHALLGRARTLPSEMYVGVYQRKLERLRDTERELNARFPFASSGEPGPPIARVPEGTDASPRRREQEADVPLCSRRGAARNSAE